jgi:hypothetical protein
MLALASAHVSAFGASYCMRVGDAVTVHVGFIISSALAANEAVLSGLPAPAEVASGDVGLYTADNNVVVLYVASDGTMRTKYAVTAGSRLAGSYYYVAQ